MAVGIIVSAAFGKIVSSLVNDILMPSIGLLLGKMDFSNLFLNFPGKSYAAVAEAKAAGAATISYGIFINNILDFTIVTFAVFLLVRQISRLKRKADTAPPAPTTKDCPYCLSKVPLPAVRCPFCTSDLAKA